MTAIPKKIHAIWLGGVLGEVGKENFAMWKKANEDYEAILWIDSCTFKPSDSNELALLIKWAKENSILICDINSGKAAVDVTNIKKRLDIYDNMLSKQYYEDELVGGFQNLAAASDILREEVLFVEGGIYVDVEDIFPSVKRLSDWEGLDNSPCGFYFRPECNDVLASIPGGTIISKIREKIHSNYNEMYKDKNKIDAHRNPELTSKNNYSDDKAKETLDSRRISTVITSGPEAIYDALEELNFFTMKIGDDRTIREKIPEYGASTINLNNKKMINLITFDPDCFKSPENQAHSWYDPDANKKLDKLIPILRSCVREYFITLIEKKINTIEDENYPEEEVKILQDFKKRIYALPVKTIDEKQNNIIIAQFKEEEKNKFIELFNFYEDLSLSMENFIVLCKKNQIDGGKIYNLLIKLTCYGRDWKMEEFVTTILTCKNSDIDVLNKALNIYDIQFEKSLEPEVLINSSNTKDSRYIFFNSNSANHDSLKSQDQSGKKTEEKYSNKQNP